MGTVHGSLRGAGGGGGGHMRVVGGERSSMSCDDVCSAKVRKLFVLFGLVCFAVVWFGFGLPCFTFALVCFAFICSAALVCCALLSFLSLLPISTTQDTRNIV